MADYMKNKTVGFLGGGNMAQAIAFGLIKKNVLKPEKIIVSSKTNRTHKEWNSQGVRTTLRNQDLFDQCQVIFLAVKPQFIDESLSQCAWNNSNRDTLFISILAGVTLDSLAKKIGQSLATKIIRAMPNTPMLLGEGFTIFCSNQYVQNPEKDAVKFMFLQLGSCEEVPEKLMNSAGGLSGCGPAFAYLMIEALADGGVKMGVPRHTATKMAAQVLIGAGKMVLETGKHPGQLKDEVCSPGGCTIAGVHAMENGAVRASLINAVTAAVEKSNEMTMVHK